MGLARSGESGKLRHKLDKQFFALDKQRLDLFVERIADSTPQRDRTYHEPRRRGNRGLGMQRHKFQVPMLEQQPAGSVFQNVTSADPGYAHLAGLIRQWTQQIELGV